MNKSLRPLLPLLSLFIAACGAAIPGADGGAPDFTSPSMVVTDLSTAPPDLAVPSPCGMCQAPTPVCNANTKKCVACLADGDCPDQSICRANACVPGCSAGHAVCGDDGSCDVDAGLCHGCLGDRDCSDPKFPQCDLMSGRCGSCSTQNDRCPAGSYCGLSNGSQQCVSGCKGDSECRAGDGGVQGASCCNHVCVDVTSSLANCGACGAACNKTACCFGACVDTQGDAANCGSCSAACPVLNDAPVCAAGKCGAGACLMGFADCDKNPQNGCETSTSGDTNNCGGCGMVCMIANAQALCLNGACALASCKMGFHNCDGQLNNGCETNTGTDPLNCGACNNNCGKLPNSTAGCMGGQCVIGMCNAGFGDCNMQNMDGCEAALGSDILNCGMCGNACPAPPNVVVSCTMGQCSMGGCAPGFMDCNNNMADGCEAQVAIDPKNCGTCGTVCLGMGQNAVAACAGGACTLGCNAGFGNCDGNAGNGCEKDLRADANNCGACNNVCPVNTPVCTAGNCTNVLKSCKDLMGGGAQSGLYMIDPDGNGPIVAFQVYCDMTMDGGGWTLAMSKIVDTTHEMTYGQSLTWNCLTSSNPPTSTMADSMTVMNYNAFTAINPTDMMLMAGKRILKFYYPRPGVAFVNNYRELTERTCYDNNGIIAFDGPNSGGLRVGCGHTNDACTTSDYAIWKAHDASCPHDATNSHADGNYCTNSNCGSFGNCPGQGTSPPMPTPNCWFYGGSNAAQIPSIAACPNQSQAAWADYSTGFLTGYYNVWVR